MNITVSKILKELENNYGWTKGNDEEEERMVRELISDTIKIINEITIREKGISIKNK